MLHSRIRGKYPDFNLSKRLVYPSERRLAAIPEALTQGYREKMQAAVYALYEDD